MYTLQIKLCSVEISFFHCLSAQWDAVHKKCTLIADLNYSLLQTFTVMCY